MAFEGIPPETRKSFQDGTTVFERVLPGADRMYPDTDSAPIPLEDATIQRLGANLPTDIIARYEQLAQWNVPADTYTFIFSKNLFPLLSNIVNGLNISPVFAATLLGHRLKNLLGKNPQTRFKASMVYPLLAFLKQEKLDPQMAWHMLPILMDHPRIEFESALTLMKFKRVASDDIIGKLPVLGEKFKARKGKEDTKHKLNWMMGQMRKTATGNVNLTELANLIKTSVL